MLLSQPRLGHNCALKLHGDTNTMFHTFPESEIPMPPPLASNGERTWQWIELPLYISYFIVTIRILDGKFSLIRTLMFGNIYQVLQAAKDASATSMLDRVDMLIPSYLHDGKGYELRQLKEVWMSDCADKTAKFVFVDGSELFDSCGNCDLLDANMNLVASF